MFSSFQNYTLKKLEKHTNYIVTIAAKNYVGLGPADVIELRTEDGGRFDLKKTSSKMVSRHFYVKFALTGNFTIIIDKKYTYARRLLIFFPCNVILFGT